MVKLIEVFESKKQSYSSHSKLYFSYSKFMKTSVCSRFYTPVDCIESRIIRPKYDLHKIEHRSMFFRFAYHSFGTALEDSRNSSLRITNTKFQTCLRVLQCSREGTDRCRYIRVIARVSDLTQLYRKGKVVA